MPAAADGPEKATYKTPCFRDLQRENAWLRGRVAELEASTAAIGCELDASQKAVHDLSIERTAILEQRGAHEEALFSKIAAV